jgi:hypothetical protein
MSWIEHCTIENKYNEINERKNVLNIIKDDMPHIETRK